MRIRVFSILCLAGVAALGCGPGAERPAEDTPDVAAAPRAFGRSIAGLYEVKGLTTEIDSGDQREIGGTLILSQQGERYTATFSLRTMFPTPSGALPAEMIGVGEGDIDGGTLSGDAETQIVLSTVPGVDTGFAFVPRHVSQRILSSTLAEISPDGQVKIEIQSHSAPGATYAATKTTLQGELVASPGTVPPLR